MTTYFHTTDVADAILQNGFQDGVGNYGMSLTFTGAFISDTPLGISDGVFGDQVLEVKLPDGVDLDDFEIVEASKPYREWCVPAEILDAHGTLRLLGEEEAGAAGVYRFAEDE